MKKGFTLVELLAVILVLAIIALITVPIVTNVILNAGEKSELQSAEFYIEAVNNTIMNNYLDTRFKEGTCTIIPNGYLDCEGNRIKVEADKTLPTSGTLLIEGRRVVDVRDMHLGDNVYNYSNGKLVASSAGEGGGCTWGVEGDYNTINCGGEVFYALYQDGNDIAMLAKYNLDAGYIYDFSSSGGAALSSYKNGNKYIATPLEMAPYTVITNTVKQSPNAVGYDGSSTAYGVIEFAQTNYWGGGGAIMESFKHNDAPYVKPLLAVNNPVYIYSEESSIYPYIESYKRYLSGLGVTVKEARLMSYDEASAIINVYYYNGGGGASTKSLPDTRLTYDATPLGTLAPSEPEHWLNSTSYWLGSADNDYVYCIYKGSTSINNEHYSENDAYGIRPTLVIQASQISGTPTYEVVDIATLIPNTGFEK